MRNSTVYVCYSIGDTAMKSSVIILYLSIITFYFGHKKARCFEVTFLRFYTITAITQSEINTLLH